MGTELTAFSVVVYGRKPEMAPPAGTRTTQRRSLRVSRPAGKAASDTIGNTASRIPNGPSS